MRRLITGAAMALVMATGVQGQGILDDLDRCGEILPTLHAYYAEKYGQSYLDGRLSPAEPDSEVNEKIRMDLRVYVCRWRVGRDEAENRMLKSLTQTTSLGVPTTVRRAMDERASRVGGEAAKQRTIRAAWTTYQRSVSRIQAGRSVMEQAESTYRGLVGQLGNARGIFVSGRDPILDR